MAFLILLASLLYSSVGHAGASGYLAAMALFGIAPEVMKPTALSLNILVAIIAFTKFYRAKCFSWKVFWPFALGSIPLAFIGGTITLPGTAYRIVVGIVLLIAAFRLFRTAHEHLDTAKPFSIPIAIGSGIIIGLLSGLTGVGGGIFLTPLLLFMGWAETRVTFGVSAAFILVNSVSGLSGHYAAIAELPSAIPIWAVSAGIGGYVGSHYGSRKLDTKTLKNLLAVVLVIAGLKLMFT